MGHIHGFGSTEEEYEELVFGVQGKGKKGDAPFDHAKRNGWLKHKNGQYYDALPSAAASLCYRASAAMRLWGLRRLRCSDMRMGLARPDTDHE